MDTENRTRKQLNTSDEATESMATTSFERSLDELRPEDTDIQTDISFEDLPDVLPKSEASDDTDIQSALSLEDLKNRLMNEDDDTQINITFEDMSDDPDASDANESTSFEKSLDELRPEDISDGAAAIRRRGTASSLIRYFILYVCLTAAFVCIILIGRSFINYQRANALYGDISDYFNSEEFALILDSAIEPSRKSVSSPHTPDFKTSLETEQSQPSTVAPSDDYNEEFELVKAKLNYLKMKNSDLYGWINVGGTNIDYPLVQYTDNDYYLNNDFYGEYLPAGSIFVDYRCDTDLLANRNTVIYGHNMLNGSMFGSIPKYLKKSFFDENRTITLTTPKGVYTYEIFSIYETDMYYSYIKTSFQSDEQFLEFAYRMRDNSIFVQKDLEFNADDRILTLSTCTNGYYIYRYALQAKLVDYVEYGGE